jgi:hypothetical protein
MHSLKQLVIHVFSWHRKTVEITPVCFVQCWSKPSVTNSLDDGQDGSGSLNFQEFCGAIMESSQAGAFLAGTSLATSAAQMQVADDNLGNSVQFLRRKVRENWKMLLVTFNHHIAAHGNLDRDGLREILYRFDIVPSDSQVRNHVLYISCVGAFMSSLSNGSLSLCVCVCVCV